ncbi:Cytochrome P450 4C1 [Orchesella cincta]|uniref:Cytochrome P450 4C1 n=1 Tax=Orchesella cincta TaxID=48709 RepID=A0A1D2MNH6_ORCCI|nr:Cytochrome P450 4C1 [Orchesella cincta]
MDWGSGLEHYFDSSANFLQTIQSRTADEIHFQLGEASLFRRLVEHNVTSLRLVAVFITVFIILTILKRVAYVNNLEWGALNRSKPNKTVKDLPGPKFSAKWLICNGFQLLSAEGFMPLFRTWCEKYGPCFGFKLFQQNVVVLNSPSMAQMLLTSGENGHLHKSPYFYDTFIPFWNDGLIVSRAEKWRNRRKIMSRAFTLKSFLGYMHVYNKAGKELVSKLTQLFSHREMDSEPKGKPIDRVLWGCALRVICETTMGLDVWEFKNAKELTETLHTCKSLCTIRLLKPWLRNNLIWYFHPRSKDLSKGIRHLQELTKSVIENHKIKAASKPNATQLEAEDELGAKKPFISMVEEMMSAGVDEKGITEEGYETTATTLQFLMFLLALYPEEQAKCREEVDKVFEDVSLCPNGELSHDALASLKHLERCIFETLRIFSVVFLIARKLETPLTIDDQLELPVGTNVLIFLQGIQTNPEYYPDPLQFKPERFLVENSQGRSQYAYLPFSAGPRNCIGFKFGLMEVKVLASWILRHFLISTTDKMEDVKLLYDIVLTPERGYNFVLSKRTVETVL